MKDAGRAYRAAGPIGRHGVRCACGCAMSRRGFLAAIGASAAAAMVAPAAIAQAPVAAPIAGLRLIDVHHHVLPPFYFQAAGRYLAAQAQGYIPPGVQGWTPQRALDEMDSNGIDTAVVSISTPGIWLGPGEGAAALARQCNEYVAGVAKDHPGRFGSFAALPLPDQDASLAEIAYALDTLKADGICLMTSYGERWLGDPSFDAVFAELNRRQAVVFVHPTAPNCCGSLIKWVPQPMLEFPFDTTRAIASLIYSGTLTKYPAIQFIFSHAGGAAPMLAGRMDELGARVRPELAAAAPEGVDALIKRLHFDLANTANRPAAAALREVVPVSQILFGSDAPFNPIAWTTGGLPDLGFSAEEMKAIGRDNALRLMPQLGA